MGWAGLRVQREELQLTRGSMYKCSFCRHSAFARPGRGSNAEQGFSGETKLLLPSSFVAEGSDRFTSIFFSQDFIASCRKFNFVLANPAVVEPTHNHLD